MARVRRDYTSASLVRPRVAAALLRAVAALDAQRVYPRSMRKTAFASQLRSAHARSIVVACALFVTSRVAAQDAGATSSAHFADAGVGGDAGDYTVALGDLRARVDELAVRRALSATPAALPVSASVAHLTVVHENRMGATFRLAQITYVLDGRRIFDVSDPGDALAQRAEIPIFDGGIAPGEHTLSVSLIFRGAGRGLFSYLQRYRFRSRATPYRFTATAGRHMRLRVSSSERPGATVPLEQRPMIRFTQQLEPR